MSAVRGERSVQEMKCCIVYNGVLLRGRYRVLLASELLLNGGLGELGGLSPQHTGDLCFAHADLLAHGHQAFREVVVVLPAEEDRQLDEVNVLQGDGCIVGVFCFRFRKRKWMLAPVSKWRQVMRCVVAVIETMTICNNVDDGDA